VVSLRCRTHDLPPCSTPRLSVLVGLHPLAGSPERSHIAVGGGLLMPGRYAGHRTDGQRAERSSCAPRSHARDAVSGEF
jgi:hypothetical protein